MKIILSLFLFCSILSAQEVGTSSQYLRGDRTWQTLNTSAVSGLKNGALFDTTGIINDSCAFTTTAVRVAVFHAGVTSTSVIGATIRLASDASTFLAADVPAVWCKKDTIVVKRFASGTSGQKYNLNGKK
jgi:hypothetical protein